MKICICSNVNDKTIRQFIMKDSQLTIKDVADELKISKNCGKCWDQFNEIYNETKQSIV